jgi:hypothetical protein
MYQLTMFLEHGSSITMVTDDIDETLMEYEAKGFNILNYEITSLTKVG